MSDPNQRGPQQSPLPPPDLAVGNIEIRGGQIRIGGMDLTGNGSGWAPMGAPAAPPPPPPSAPVPPVAAPSARPMASPSARPAARPLAASRPPASAATATLPASVESPTAVAGSSRHEADQTALATVPQAASPVGIPARSSTSAPTTGVVVPDASRVTVVNIGGAHPFAEKLGLAGTTVGILVAAERAVEWGAPLGMVVGSAAVALATMLGAWWLARRRGLSSQVSGERTLRDKQLERDLVLLADRQGGVVRVVDVVREQGLSFEEAQELLSRLASRGHATMEFDPQTQGPLYRIG